MDDGEPSQLYRTLLLEQEMNPSQAVEVLIAYYKMSEEEAVSYTHLTLPPKREE